MAPDLLIAIVIFLVVFATTLTIGNLVRQILIVRRRLADEPGHAASPKARFLRPRGVSNPFLLWVEASSSISDARTRRKLTGDLLHAGFEHPAAPVWFVVIRFSLAIGLPIAFLLVRRVLGHAAATSGAILSSMVLCAVGLLLPRAFIDRRARLRNAQLERQFPDALDLLVVCVEAGLGLGAAFVRVAREVRESHPRVASELERVSEQFRAGQGHSDALRSMADRCDVSIIKSFAALVAQTEQIGGSIAQSLRTYSREMREVRMLKAEEKALRIPVLMTVPLVACILPVIIVALLLPAMIDVVRVLLPTLTRHGG